MIIQRQCQRQPYRKLNNSTQPVDSIHFLEAFLTFLASLVGLARRSLAQSQFHLAEQSISWLLPPHFQGLGDTIYMSWSIALELHVCLWLSTWETLPCEAGIIPHSGQTSSQSHNITSALSLLCLKARPYWYAFLLSTHVNLWIICHARKLAYERTNLKNTHKILISQDSQSFLL